MKTTLNKIMAYSPCAKEWEKLLKATGKTTPDDEPIDFSLILNSNGLGFSFWCLRAADGHDDEIRLFAVWCARQNKHPMLDRRSISALDVAEKFAHGQATKELLNEAHREAMDAALEASRLRELGYDSGNKEASVILFTVKEEIREAAYDVCCKVFDIVQDRSFYNYCHLAWMQYVHRKDSKGENVDLIQSFIDAITEKFKILISKVENE